MKVRQGFVSNSSSSSFLIALAVIKEGCVSKVREALKDSDKWHYNIRYIGDILKEKSWDDPDVTHIKEDKFKVTLEAPINDMVTVSLFCSSNSDILVINQGNDEGDSDFWDDRYQELNYDKVDLDYFDSNIVDLLNHKEYFSNVQMEYGAGRNG